MGGARGVELRVIPAKIAGPFIRRVHYSHKTVNNSQLHFGAFYDGKLHGVMSFGPPLDKSKVIHLVADTPWSGMLELNRMAFDDVLPRNSESRCISIACRMIRKQAPQVKWILSFADACSCGDGTIYRASGFVLTGIQPNRNIARLPSGEEIHKMTLESTPTKPRKELGGRSYFDVTGGAYNFARYIEVTHAERLVGYQLRYIRIIDPAYRDKLTVPVIPFSRIGELGIGMYRGEHMER